MITLNELQELEDRADNGEPDALYKSGLVYWTGRWIEGIAVAQDKRKAIDMIQRASDYGHEEASSFIAKNCKSTDLDLANHNILPINNEKINEYDENGETLLLIAVKQGNLEEVKLLLDKGADPDKEDETWNVKPIDIVRKKVCKNKIYWQIGELLEEASRKYESTKPLISTYNTRTENYANDTSTTSITLSGLMFILGFISLILAPFTGITVLTAAGFFIIGWIIEKKGG